MNKEETSWLDAGAVEDVLASAPADAGRIREVLQKARELKGLNAAEVAALCQISAPDQLDELFASARRVKEEIYGRRMVLFAPLYISNVCGNECTYCAFRASNKALPRTALDPEAIARDTAELVRQGHKRLLLVAGEGYPAARGGFDYVLEAIAGGRFGSGGAQAASFCLHVLNDQSPFNLARAICTWDQGNRAAFQAWSANPWTL